MTMPPSGIQSEMDEEAVIEAEIQQQLELIDLNIDDANNNVDDAGDDMGLGNLDLNVDASNHGEEFVVDEVKGYLRRLQKQTEKFEEELNECDDLVNYHKPGDSGVTENMEELLQAAETSGVDPHELRRQILEAIEKEDDLEDVTDEDISTLLDTKDISMPEDTVFVTSEVELVTESPKEGTDQAEELEENITLEPGQGVVAVVDEIHTQEEFFRQQLRDMDVKYRERETRWKQESEMRRKEEEERENAENVKRQQILEHYEEEKEALEHQNKISQQKLDTEVEEKRKIIQDEVKKFEEQITLLESETRREQEELEKSFLERQERQKHKEKMAATTLQAGFRGYRVRKSSKTVLQQKREERAKQREQKRIDEVEKDIQERKETEKLKDEERIRIESEKQEEEERKIKEEKERLEEEERKKEEEKRLEEERKRREEEKRLEEKKRKEEEERKKLEKKMEEERLMEEKRRKEEEKLEEERKRLEKEKQEVERKKLDAERLEREKKEQEEAEKKVQEERMKKEEMERKLQEEKEKEIKLEQERESEEKRLKEENEKLKEELKKLKEGANDAKHETLTAEKEIKSSVNIEELSKNKTGDEGHKSSMTTSDIRKSLSEKRQQLQRAHAEDVEHDTLGRTLPQHMEDKRLAWIKECLPWSKISNEPWKLKGGVSKKPPRRPSSAKKLPPLAEDVITAAARVATMKQVTTVQLSDLPGCNMSTLGQCWGLKSLTMTNCNLVVLDGLQQCRQLQYLCVKRNKLEYIDLKDLGSLQVVDLSNNNLSVLHGLDGCTNIRWLDLSCNRITRLGGLDPLRRLHTLLLSSNQLISCTGISDVPTLQHLDLSNNHLQEVDGLHKLCLLQRLSVASNNLLQFPSVCNQVLLEECDLSDNSISSLEGVASYWLPMLASLNLSKNSLNELEVLDSLLLLRSLDVSNNQLLDLESICSSLSCQAQLEELNIVENPATDGISYKEKLVPVLPRLRRLDGESVEVKEDNILQPKTDFEAMCRTHAQFHTSIRNTFLQDLQSTESKTSVNDLALCDVYFRYCDKSFKLAVEHRYAHEYGEVSVTVPVAPSTPKSGRPRSARTKLLHTEPETYLSPKEMFEKALKSDTQTPSRSDSQAISTVKEENRTGADNPKDLFEKALKSTGEDPHLRSSQIPGMENPKSLFVKALELQTLKDNDDEKYPFEKLQENDISVRASLQNLPPDEMAILEELHASATKIQALWRGYFLRLKLTAALDYARMEEEDDVSELDDFNMDDLAFDEESLEKGWRPAETPQIPHSHPVLGKPPSGRQGGVDVLKLELAPVHPPNRPRQAWRNLDSPLSDLTPHPPRPPSSVMTASDTHRTGLSKKEEKLADEWGFHNSRTAELMLQRAKKMKLNADRKKKLSKLDPKQRLALFRKLEETTKLSPIRPPVRKTLPRKEYFRAREEEVQKQEFEKRQEDQTRSTRTYEWLHTQVAGLDTQDRIMERHSNFGSEGIQSTSGSDMGSRRMMNYGGYDGDSHQEERRARRFSSGETMSNSGQTTYLPPIHQTNSAGSGGSNGGPRRKEKMSWRNKPTDVDVGWGGGKKRQTHK